MQTQSLPVKEQFLLLLDLAYEVAQSLGGKLSPDARWPDCQSLATKLFFHAATIFRLRDGSTNVPVPKSIGGASFYDFASVVVLTRAAFETYLTIYDVFFNHFTDDDFEFKHSLWLLTGFVIREKFVISNPNLQIEYPNILKETQEMRSRLQKTEKYKSMTPKQQKKLANGESPRKWKEVAKKAGFGENYIHRMYSYYSGYVHSDGLSSTQIASAKSAPEQIVHMESDIQMVMVVLSKLILDYSNKFPESKATCEKNPIAYYLAEVWTLAASSLN